MQCQLKTALCDNINFKIVQTIRFIYWQKCSCYTQNSKRHIPSIPDSDPNVYFVFLL